MTHISLFTGIGGIDLAAEWAGFGTIAQVERDSYCLRVLERHWPHVHRVSDIKSFPDRDYGAVTLVSGGFPCQPFSTAGKRRGKDDNRYLWPEMWRVIAEIKPAWIVAENVAGLTSMAQFDSLPKLGLSAGNQYRIGDIYRRTGSGILRIILEEIESLGYEVTPFLIPASGAGANHERKRVFIVAHSSGQRTRRRSETVCQTDGRPNGTMCGKPIGASKDVAHAESQRCTWPISTGNSGRQSEGTFGDSSYVTNATSRGEQSGGTQRNVGRFQDKTMRGAGNANYWPIEPNVGRVAHGVPHRVDRLKGLGNAVVPQQVYPILQAIACIQKAHKPL